MAAARPRLTAFACLACLLLLVAASGDARPDPHALAEYQKWMQSFQSSYNPHSIDISEENDNVADVNFSVTLAGSDVNLTSTKSSKSSKKKKSTITVALDGKGQFSRIQDAVDSVPEKNSKRVVIRIKKGIYVEKVVVPSSKPYITFYGDGLHLTEVRWNDTASTLNSSGNGVLGTFGSATVAVNADYFIATEISFVNTAPAPEPGAVGRQAVAFRITGDKAAFYSCGFYGAQDTLYDHRGKHYFKDCFIQGSIDYIFGNGQSIYQSCKLNSIATTFGSVTAQKRDFPSEKTGFSFINCVVEGGGSIFLGRAWGNYSRTVYSYCYIGDLIRTGGWDNFGFPYREKNVFYGEYKCSGPGSNTSTWPVWAHKLTKKQAKPFLSLSFISGKKWLQKP